MGVRGGSESRRRLKQMLEPWLSEGKRGPRRGEEQVHRPWGLPCRKGSGSCKEIGVAGAE